MMPASPMMGGGAPTPILDIVGSATVAYSSARLLRTGAPNAFQAVKYRSATPTTSRGLTGSLYLPNGDVDVQALQDWIDINPLDEAASIREWFDQSGNGNLAFNYDSNLLRLPVFYASGMVYLNGRLTPYFFSSDVRNLGLTTAINLASDYVCFIVTTPANNVAQLGGTSAANGGTNSAIRCGTTTHTVNDASGSTTTTTGTSSASVARFEKLSGTRKIYVNGVEIASTSASSTRNNTLSHIGRVLIGGTTSYFGGRLCEIIFYNRAMTAGEINTVESNLREYYGV